MPASAQARSGNPAKRAATKKAAAGSRALTVSSVEDWGDDEGELIELPSGKVVRIERIPLPTLIAENLLGDSLSVIAAKAVEQGQGLSQEETAELAKDPEKIAEVLDAFDKAAARAIIEPIVLYYKVTAELVQQDPELFGEGDIGKPIPKDKRLPRTLYSDKIMLEDKIFIFQVISGGTSDLQRFREQHAESLAGLSTQ